MSPQSVFLDIVPDHIHNCTHFEQPSNYACLFSFNLKLKPRTHQRRSVATRHSMCIQCRPKDKHGQRHVRPDFCFPLRSADVQHSASPGKKKLCRSQSGASVSVPQCGQVHLAAAGVSLHIGNNGGSHCVGRKTSPQSFTVCMSRLECNGFFLGQNSSIFCFKSITNKKRWKQSLHSQR